MYISRTGGDSPNAKTAIVVSPVEYNLLAEAIHDLTVKAFAEDEGNKRHLKLTDMYTTFSNHPVRISESDE